MSRLLIEPVTPDEPGYIALKAESVALNFNMLRRLEENWQRGENRFNAPGEKLLGAFLNGKLVGICGLNRDPFSQQSRAGYRQAAARCGDGRCQHMVRFSQYPCAAGRLGLLPAVRLYAGRR